MSSRCTIYMRYMFHPSFNIKIYISKYHFETLDQVFFVQPNGDCVWRGGWPFVPWSWMVTLVVKMMMLKIGFWNSSNTIGRPPLKVYIKTFSLVGLSIWFTGLHPWGRQQFLFQQALPKLKQVRLECSFHIYNTRFICKCSLPTSHSSCSIPAVGSCYLQDKVPLQLAASAQQGHVGLAKDPTVFWKDWGRSQSGVRPPQKTRNVGWSNLETLLRGSRQDLGYPSPLYLQSGVHTWCPLQMEQPGLWV